MLKSTRTVKLCLLSARATSSKPSVPRRQALSPRSAFRLCPPNFALLLLLRAPQPVACQFIRKSAPNLLRCPLGRPCLHHQAVKNSLDSELHALHRFPPRKTSPEMLSQTLLTGASPPNDPSRSSLLLCNPRLAGSRPVQWRLPGRALGPQA